jgi:hypothetical protein
MLLGRSRTFRCSSAPVPGQFQRSALGYFTLIYLFLIWLLVKSLIAVAD